jgi:hypothetical protein
VEHLIAALLHDFEHGRMSTNQCDLTFGDTFIIPRNGRQGRPTPLVDHIAITVENFDKNAAKAELERRGLAISSKEMTP